MGKHLLKSPAKMRQSTNKTQGFSSAFKGSSGKKKQAVKKKASGLDITEVSCFTHNI